MQRIGKPTEEQMKRKRERARARYALMKAQLQEAALAGTSGEDPFARRRARDRERYARKKALLQLRAPTEAQLEHNRQRERERYARKTALQGLTQAELERKRANNRARYARLKALRQLEDPAEKEGVGRKPDKTRQKTEQRQREVEAATQCDKSTWFFCPSASKCTQADIGHISISTCTQYEDPTLVRHSPFLLEQPQTKKAVPVVRRSSRPPGQVQRNLNSDKAVGSDHKPATAVTQGKKSSPGVTTARTRMPYACAVCSLEFQQVSDLATHTDVCPWPVPVQCGVCPYMCENWNETRIHMTTHIRKAPAKCPMCNYRLSGRNWLSVRHLLDHVAVKQYSCNMCGAEFVCGQDLSRHNVQRHIGQASALRRRTSGKMHKCDICSAGFAYTRALMNHMRCHVETKVGQLQVTLPGPLQVVVPRAGLTMGLQASHVPET